MNFSSNQQYSAKALIIYMISTLLFLTSIELHIHTQEAAASADHGYAVSISSISTELAGGNSADEINVSPDGLLKVHHDTPDVIAVFLLLILILAIFSRVITPPYRETRFSPVLPFYGSPALRAPPQ